MDPQAQLQLLLDLTADSKTSNYTFIASFALLLVDYFITLSDEIELVWTSPGWSVGKTLFMINRYYTIAIHSFNTYVNLNHSLSTQGLTLPQYCFHWIQAQPGTSAIVGWLIDFIILLRVIALWGCGRVITTVLSCFYAASSLSLLTLLIVAFRHTEALDRPGPFLTGCFGANIPTWFSNVFFIPAIYITVMFLLTAIPTFTAYRRSAASLSTLFFKDGVLHTAVVLAVILANLLLNKFGRPTLAPAVTGLYVVLPSIMGSRILLNMFAYVVRRPTSDRDGTRTTFKFADLKGMSYTASSGGVQVARRGDTTLGGTTADIELDEIVP